MQVHTYTNMWNEEKKLYSIYEWELPTPVGFRQIGLFAFGAIIWMPIMYMFRAVVPINTAIGLVIWFSVPVLLAFLGNKQIFEKKSIFHFAQSYLGFLMEPKYVLDGQGISLKSEKMVDLYSVEEIHEQKNQQITNPHILNFEIWTKDEL